MATGRHPMFKLVLLGEPGVGKSSLFFRTKDNDFKDGQRHTIGIDSCTRIIQTSSGKIKFCLWDTAGVERFRTLTRNYYRNTHAVLLVYSVDNNSSLSYLSKWAQDATDFAPMAQRFLIGNKIDLSDEVSNTTIENFCMGHNCDSAYLISAKTGKGIETAMSSIGEKLIENYQESQSVSPSWLEDNGPNKLDTSEKTCC